MREGRLFLTGVVGTVLLGALVLVLGLDLSHHGPPVSGYPNTWHPVQPPPKPVDPPSKPLEPAPNKLGQLDPQHPSLGPLLNAATAIELQALDRNLTIQLTPDQTKRLMAALATSTLADVPSPSYLIPQYPSLSLTVHGPGGSAEIRLNNVKRLSAVEPLTSNGAPWVSWTMPPGLWAEVAGWLPPETSKPGEVAYLLRAEQLIEPYPSGPLVYDAGRAALMARLLQAGTPIAQTTGEVQFTHTYVVEGKQYPLQVGVDWFTYAGHSYQLKDAALMLGATLHAN